jgi:hypothetical protein
MPNRFGQTMLGMTGGTAIMRKYLIVWLVAGASLTQAAAQGARTWLFDDSSDLVTLQYGTPESDDVVIAVSCEAGSKTMRITEFAGSSSLTPGRPARLKLSNGSQTIEYSGQAVANEMDGGVNLEVATAPDAKFFALLKSGASLTIDVGGKQATVPLKAAAPYVASLEKVCLAKR